MHDTARAGFKYTVETIVNGEVVDTIEAHNLIPVEGINHLLSVGLLGASQVTQWYLALYENDYAPQAGDTAATLPGLAGETTAYVSATRMALVPGAPAAGVLDNADNRAEFEFTGFTGQKTIRGGFIVSASPKGSTAGVALSAVRFPSPRVVDAGAILRVTAGLQITSA